MEINPIVRAQNLTKYFGRRKVISQVNLEVYPQECLGILGPNAAGKTTLINMICCICRKTSGELTVFDLDGEVSNREIKAKIGLVPQEDNLDTDLNVEDNLLMYSRYFGIPKAVAKKKVDKWLEFFQLHDRKKDRIKKLSTGLKRRLLIARAMINDPKLLVIDEPTINLDLQSQDLLWDKLRQLHQQRSTQIIATHNMEEAEKLCDHLLIIDAGKVIIQGRPHELILNEVPPEVVEVYPTDGKHNEILNIARHQTPYYKLLKNKLLLYTYNGLNVLSLIKQSEFKVRDMILRKTNLEDVFLKFTDRQIANDVI